MYSRTGHVSSRRHTSTGVTIRLPSFYHYISWYPHEYACVQISSKCCVSYRIAYYTVMKKEKLFTNSCWVDPPCRSFISAPLWSLSSLVRPCEGVKGQAGFYFIFFKGLEGRPACIYTQHKQQRERLRHKGTPAWRRRSSAYRRGRVEMRASESSVCVCAHMIDCQLNPINRHWTNQSTLELLDATNSIYFSANNCTSEACDAKFCPWPSCFLCGRQL